MKRVGLTGLGLLLMAGLVAPLPASVPAKAATCPPYCDRDGKVDGRDGRVGNGRNGRVDGRDGRVDGRDGRVGNGRNYRFDGRDGKVDGRDGRYSGRDGLYRGRDGYQRDGVFGPPPGYNWRYQGRDGYGGRDGLIDGQVPYYVYPDWYDDYY